MTSPGYAAAAPVYRDAGWLGVLPIKPGAKSPTVSGFHGKKARGRYPSDALVRGWGRLRDNQTANIAIRPGEDVIGIDVDAYDGKRGGAALAEATRRWGPLPATWRSTSRPGDDVSGISWFRVPEGGEWRDLKRALNGEDEVRANDPQAWADVETIWWGNRYGVVWPSVHPEGRPYVWFNPTGEVAERVPSPDELADLPTGWVAGLSKPDEPAPVARVRASHFSAAPVGPGPDWGRAAEFAPNQTEWVARGIDARLADVAASVGARNEALNEHAMRVWRLWLTGASSLTEAEVESRLLDAVAATGYLRSDGEDAAIKTIRSAKEGAMKHGPADMPDPNWTTTASDDGFDGKVRDRLEWLQVDQEARRLLNADDRKPIPNGVEWTDLIEREAEEVRWLVEDLWAENTNILLGAMDKAGKTTLRNNVIRSLVDGAPFLDRFPAAPLGDGERVGVLDFEMPESLSAVWARRQGIERLDSVTMWSLRGQESAFNLLDRERLADWAEVLRAAQIRTLILDCYGPWVSSMGLNEDSNADAEAALGALRRLAHEAGVREVFVIHHTTHDGMRPRGASRLLGWPDAIWLLGVLDSNDRQSPRLFRGYGRDVAQPERALIFTEQNQHLSITDEFDRKAIKQTYEGVRATDRQRELADVDRKVGLIQEWLRGRPNGASGNEVRKNVRGRNGTLDLALKAGVERGQFRVTGTGVETRYYADGQGVLDEVG